MWRGEEIWPVEHKQFRHSTMRSGSSSSSSRFKIRPKQVNASTCDFDRCCLQLATTPGHTYTFRGKLYVDQSNSCTYLRVWRARCLSFRDMHRELYRFFVVGDTVIVELALQGTQNRPLELPFGTIPPTGKRMNAPCCDVFL